VTDPAAARVRRARARVRRAPRLGVYGFGGCDLDFLPACASLLSRGGRREVGVRKEGMIASSHSRLMLAAARGRRPRGAAAAARFLRLPPGYFDAGFAGASFRVDGRSFPRSAAVLSIAADFARTLYRHRRSGLLVDPGAWWLRRDYGEVLSDLSRVERFRRDYAPAGLVSAREFSRNLARLVSLLRRRGAGRVVVLSARARRDGGEEGSRLLERRRREFNRRLFALARRHGFAAVDLDAVARAAGRKPSFEGEAFPAGLRRPLARAVAALLDAP
jgi:hypothetical protein